MSSSITLRVGVLFLLGLVAFGCTRLDPAMELTMGAEALAAKNYGEAGIRLDNVIQLAPDNAQARQLRGELALLLGDYEMASKEFDRARELGVSVQSVALGLADARAALGEPEHALDLLDAVAAELSTKPDYWITRAGALLRANRAEDAERAMEEADAHGATGIRAQVARARVMFARGNSLGAEQALDQASSMAPNDPSVLVARAELFARSQRLPEAAADLTKAADLYRTASLGPRAVAALFALVQIDLARNDLDGAEATVKRLAQEAPGATASVYLSSLVEYRRGRFDEAATLIQPLVNAAPQVIQFRALLGAIQLARGNFGQAEQQFQAVLGQSPGDPAAVKLLAETRLRQQRPEAALSALRAIDGSAADDAQVGLLRGLATLLSGDTQQGLVYLEQAAALDPSNELIKVQLARAYLAAGRDKEASTLLEGAFAAGSAPLEAGLMRLFADMRLGAKDAGGEVAAQLLQQFPQDARVLTAVGVYFQLHAESRRAQELFERAANVETEGATARLLVAATWAQQGRTEEAERLLERVVAQQPDNAQALTALAEIVSARGAFDKAAELLGRAAQHTASVSPRLALVQLEIRRGDLIAAKRQLEIVAETERGNPEVIALGGLLALADGRPEDATALLSRAEPLLPNRLGVSLGLARAQLASGRPDAARTTLRRVLAIAPQSVPVRVGLGETELKLGNAEEALSIAAALKADYPAQAAGYLLEADVRIATRRYAAAVDDLEKAFRQQQTWPILARLIAAQQFAGQHEGALQTAQDWVASHPQHVPGGLAMASLLQEARRYDDALAAYQAVLSLDSNNVVALNNAAWISHELSHPNALELAQRAYDRAPQSAAVLDTLGWILLGQNREQDAIDYLSRAAELAPDAAEIRYHRAKALIALGRSKEARDVLAGLVREDFEHRPDAQRLLDSM